MSYTEGDLGVLTSAEDVLSRQSQLMKMAHMLDSVCAEAAAETRLFVSGGTPEQRAAGFIDVIDAHVQRLMPLWYVVERMWRSKANMDDVAKAVAEYRAQEPVEPPDLHKECYRPAPPVDLVYFRQAGGREMFLSVNTLGSNTLAGTDTIDLRYLLATLEDAAERVRDALDQQRMIRHG